MITGVVAAAPLTISPSFSSTPLQITLVADLNNLKMKNVMQETKRRQNMKEGGNWRSSGTDQERYS